MENDDYFEDEEFSPIRSLLGLLTFSTILPIPVYTSIEYMTKLTWCWPFLHLFVGALAAACGYVCLNFLHLNSFFTAAIVYAFLMLITGYNHLDGVMDMADGVMVHGEPERKIRVMKDASVGAGGVATLFLVASLTIAGNSIIVKTADSWNRKLFHAGNYSFKLFNLNNICVHYCLFIGWCCWSLWSFGSHDFRNYNCPYCKKEFCAC